MTQSEYPDRAFVSSQNKVRLENDCRLDCLCCSYLEQPDLIVVFGFNLMDLLLIYKQNVLQAGVNKNMVDFYKNEDRIYHSQIYNGRPFKIFVCSTKSIHCLQQKRT